MSKNVNISKAKLKDFLTFAKVDKKIWQAVANMSRVSPRTSREILTISNKGRKYVNALIDLSEQIRNGIGAASLQKAVDDIVLGKKAAPSQDEQVVTLPSGEVIATWNNNNLTFNEDIDFNQDDLEQHLVAFFSKK